jgi:hypothetical protein
MPSRRAAVVLLLLSACASWETATPDYAAPPSESPTPSSHYAPPPPPVGPSEPGTPDGAANDRVAIASVQLLGDCPDPVEAEIAVGAARESQSQSRSPGYRAQCEQSTVQLAVRSDRAGSFRIDAIRVLDGDRPRLAGTSTLRQPTYWKIDSGVYQAWDGRVAAETDLKISYKLGELDLAQASKLVDPEFNAYLGPFVLELDVSIDGRRQTIRSMPFSREPIAVIQT